MYTNKGPWPETGLGVSYEEMQRRRQDELESYSKFFGQHNTEEEEKNWEDTEEVFY